ncbi:MAG: FKBP-type peptidyl-prolyl cis-trans isomerase [Acidimicrobiales bacterium]
MSKLKQIRFPSLLLALFLGLALAFTACGGDDDDSSAAIDAESEEADGESDDGADGEPAPTPEPTSAPTPTPAPEIDNTDLDVKPLVLVPDEDPPATLEAEDIVVGSGSVAASGDYLIMQYVGVSYSSGLEFDASWERGQPFTFTLGEGQVISGWDEGIAGMAVGGRRVLVIPPDQAYGESGSGSGSIGPNETLIFAVDLVGVVPAELEKPEVEVPEEPATELVVEDLWEGTGETAAPCDPEALDDCGLLWVHYVGVAQSDGVQFDSTWDRGRDQLVIIALGLDQVIPGWDEGMEGMKVGGRRKLVIPPELAYGEAGAGDGLIAPDETLVFVVDLIAIS